MTEGSMSEAHADADGSTVIVVRAGATGSVCRPARRLLAGGRRRGLGPAAGERSAAARARASAGAGAAAPGDQGGSRPASWDLLDFLIVPVPQVASWRDGPGRSALAGADRSSLTEGIQPGAA